MQSAPLFALLLAAPLALAAPAAAFSELYVFGDSLSDTGHTSSNLTAFPDGTCADADVFPRPPYATGACTNGSPWVETLAQQLGLAAEPATTGGTSYAVGGATAATDALGTALGDPDGETEDLSDQLARFQADHPAAAPDALYVILAGANDVQFTARGTLVPESGQDVAQEAADAVLATAQQLSALGAEHFLFANLFDLGLVPDPSSSFDAAEASALTADFNAALAAGVAGFEGGTAQLLDTRALFEAILADPASFGVSDTTSPCILSGLFEAPQDLDTACGLDPALQDEHLFFDEIHPTRAVHDELAGEALALVPEPATALLLGGGLAGLGAQRRKRPSRSEGRTGAEGRGT